MLTGLSVKNFRLLRDVTIDVEPGRRIPDLAALARLVSGLPLAKISTAN
jgi:hypothetical protein